MSYIGVLRRHIGEDEEPKWERDGNYYLRFRVEGSGECRVKGFGAYQRVANSK